jgi:hypothetical protein
MNRWTAKFLLLVLLGGMCAPMAAAVSMPADHCLRKPLATTMPSMPGCHPHDHDHATEAKPSDTSLTIRSKQCCNGHECCRSMVRSHSAHIGPRTLFQEIDRIDDYVSLRHAPLVKLELAAYRSVRGPPAL